MPLPMPRAAPTISATLPSQPAGHASLWRNVCLNVSSSTAASTSSPWMTWVKLAGRPIRLMAVLIDESKQHAGIDAGQRADAALQADAADHHGGEGVEQQADAEIGRGAGGADRQQPAGQAGDGAGQDEGDDQVALDADAGAERRRLVAADHDQVAAERRLGHDQREDDEAEDRDPGGERQAEQALDAEPADGRRQVLRGASARNRHAPGRAPRCRRRA